jgi:hypothetical protein
VTSTITRICLSSPRPDVPAHCHVERRHPDSTRPRNSSRKLRPYRAAPAVRTVHVELAAGVGWPESDRSPAFLAGHGHRCGRAEVLGDADEVFGKRLERHRGAALVDVSLITQRARLPPSLTRDGLGAEFLRLALGEQDAIGQVSQLRLGRLAVLGFNGHLSARGLVEFDSAQEFGAQARVQRHAIRIDQVRGTGQASPGCRVAGWRLMTGRAVVRLDVLHDDHAGRV